MTLEADEVSSLIQSDNLTVSILITVIIDHYMYNLKFLSIYIYSIIFLL